jgi:predicted anti-sigma-YlaC factor YlaD
MNCKEARALFSVYVDGELKKQIQTSLKEHLMNCPGCQSEFHIFQMNLKILRKLKTLNPPRDYASSAGRAKRPRRP